MPSVQDVFPQPETDGGWEVAKHDGSINSRLLREVLVYHNSHRATKTYGGAIVVVHRGHIVAESYVTGERGGPQPWSRLTCNDIKSSTKSVFGTLIGIFLNEFGEQVTLNTKLIGTGRKKSLIPQIWEQSITDERKTKIQVRHVLSMTSGHDSREPWLAPSRRRRYSRNNCSYQMYEYCFGWWRFDGIPSQHKLLFEPGTGFNYSNFGLEQLGLAMRNVSGKEVGRYAWEKVLKEIGMPVEFGKNFYRDIPYLDDREFNYSETPGWGVGGSEGCNAYGSDKSRSPIGQNTVVGSTFRCNARDFARLGYLWLRRGRWGKRQLVPNEWITKAATRFEYQDGSRPVNYGYTFWIKDDVEGVPIDTFGSRGHNVNDCYVIPSLDLVIARLGNANPQKEQREDFINNLLTRVVRAVKME